MHTFKKVASVAALCFTIATSCFAAEGTVITNGLNIRTAPSTDSAVISQANTNDTLDITSKEGSFYRIMYNGQVAYAAADYVSVNVKSVGTVTAELLNIRSEPSASSKVVGQLAAGDQINLTAVCGNWYEILLFGELRFVHRDYVSARDASLLPSRDGTGFVRAGSRVVEYSKKYLGTPYVSGGSSPSGFDCSGFTSYVYGQFGYDLSRTAHGQATQGVYVAKSDLIPGDLVFFNTYGGISHVGIFIGGDSFIHATVPGDVVRIGSLSSSYYSSRYVTARRIIN